MHPGDGQMGLYRPGPCTGCRAACLGSLGRNQTLAGRFLQSRVSLWPPHKTPGRDLPTDAQSWSVTEWGALALCIRQPCHTLNCCFHRKKDSHQCTDVISSVLAVPTPASSAFLVAPPQPRTSLMAGLPDSSSLHSAAAACSQHQKQLVFSQQYFQSWD